MSNPRLLVRCIDEPRVFQATDVMIRLPTINPYKETAMRFLSLYKTVERTSPPTAEEMATMGKLIEEGMKAGWLLATEGCLPTALGARVRRSNSDVTVTDGPFTE